MNTKRFLVPENAKVKLDDYPTDFTGDYTDKEQAKKDLEKNIKRLTELQDVLWAQDVQSLLIIFQAMDAAGKDSAIKHVMSGLNPQGVHVTSFKEPSAEDLDHDYLWRAVKHLPERGRIGIFNRSYYEEVLIARVHPAILQNQKLPPDIKTDKNIWQKRFRQIRHFEDYLAENGIFVLKFFLHISKEEQKKRFLDRIEESDKHWKFSASDVKDRRHWDDYQKAYAEAVENTSTKNAPWFIVPADKKWFTRIAVSEIIIEKLESLDLHYPRVSKEHRESLLEAKKMLEE
jgi:PPK2 family polyphosphate:nucleotide phosphotransferase